MYEYMCTLDVSSYDCGAVDGDTVDIILDLGFKISHRVRIRLLLVDTPERGEEEFKEATEALREDLRRATAAVGRLRIRTHKRGKYGRWLGEFTSLDHTINVNAEMEAKWPYEEH